MVEFIWKNKFVNFEQYVSSAILKFKLIQYWLRKHYTVGILSTLFFSIAHIKRYFLEEKNETIQM